MGNRRARHWTFIVYPESAPKNWKELLRSTHVKIAISPLHDKDLNPTGDEKKPHWHVFLEYDSLKSFDQVNGFIKELLDEKATICQIVQSPVGMIRYFIHMDNPEKAQYKWSDIIVYNGLDLSKYDTYTESEMDHIFGEITAFIDDNAIMEYADLIAALRDPDGSLFDWYRIVRKNTIFFNSYVSSRRNQYKQWWKEQQQKQIVKNIHRKTD